jgi:predicted MPP superfamily phosphohydrolase
MIRLVHLSDIHFNKKSGDHWDVDTDLRNELLLDAARQFKTLGKPDLLLIGGDVAFGGKKDEYVRAREWLTELMEKLEVQIPKVLIVPGNHDVDQGIVKASSSLYDVQEKLRRAEGKDIDKFISDYMNDTLMNKNLFAPIGQYNDFAAGFGSDVSLGKPLQQRRLEFDDGSSLVVIGLNSVLTSNHNDNVYRRVVLGGHQIPQRRLGESRIVLCHHPHDWWSDADSVRNAMNERASLQLFGHKHSQSVLVRENSLHLVAGAVHPARTEQLWQPRYNWVELDVEGKDANRQMQIRVYPRLWSDAKAHFDSDYNSCAGQPYLTTRVPLEAWSPVVNDVTTPVVTVPTMESPMAHSETNPDALSRADAIRILAFRFFELPHVRRIEITCALKLLTDADEGLQDRDLFQRALERAAAGNQLAALWDAVQQRHGDKKFATNPF